MSGVFVSTETAISEGTCRSILGFRNALNVSIADASTIAFSDSAYPLDNLFDYSYNSEFSPDLTVNATSMELIFNFSSSTPLSYFGINSKNAQASGLSVTVEIIRIETGVYETVAGFGSMTDGKPVMIYFGSDYDSGYANAISAKITLSYSSKPYIMSMNLGKAIAFPRSFSTGFQPAHMAYLDQVEQFYSDDGFNLVIGRRLSKGKQLKGTINFVKMTTLNDFWLEYANHVLNSKPFFLMWNNTRSEEVIYGAQNPDNLTKPAYKNSSFSAIDFDVVGWA